MRRNQSPMFVLIIALVMMAVFFAIVAISLIGPNPTVRVEPLALGVLATPTPITLEAEQVVGRMYDALTNGNDLEYLHTLPLESRGRIRPGRILSGIIEQTRVQLSTFEIPLEYLNEVAYNNMSYSGEWQREGYVIVHARGLAYLAALKAEYKMCDVWDVRRYDEGWLVDVDAAERSVRLQYLDERRSQENPPPLDLPFGLGAILKRLTTSPEDNIRVILNSCE
jgi:hypothetical protein